MTGDRVVYYFYYKEHLKLCNHTPWCFTALYVFCPI